MSIREQGREVRTRSPSMTFALAAFATDLAVVLLPLSGGTSPLSIAMADGFSVRVKLANLLGLLAGAIAIVVAIALLRRGRRAMAAGAFVALAVVLGARILSSILTTIGEGWRTGTTIFLGLQTLECVLLVLAARTTIREGPPTT